jgi:hypothetical protein
MFSCLSNFVTKRLFAGQNYTMLTRVLALALHRCLIRVAPAPTVPFACMQRVALCT